MDKERSNYFNKMGLPDDFSRKQQKAALKTAHEIRRFEIELFWKRAAFFWAFILASYTAYFFILYGEDKSGTACDTRFMKDILLCLTSFMGFFFSYALLLANKGSKFWQENWERHIDCLEREITGDLHKTYLNTSENEMKPCPANLEAYNYSVTKITIAASLVLTVGGLCVFVVQIGRTVFGVLKFLNEPKKLLNLIKITALILYILYIFLLPVVAVIILKKLPQRVKGNKDDEEMDIHFHKRRINSITFD